MSDRVEETPRKSAKKGSSSSRSDKLDPSSRAAGPPYPLSAIGAFFRAYGVPNPNHVEKSPLFSVPRPTHSFCSHGRGGASIQVIPKSVIEEHWQYDATAPSTETPEFSWMLPISAYNRAEDIAALYCQQVDVPVAKLPGGKAVSGHGKNESNSSTKLVKSKKSAKTQLSSLFMDDSDEKSTKSAAKRAKTTQIKSRGPNSSKGKKPIGRPRKYPWLYEEEGEHNGAQSGISAENCRVCAQDDQDGSTIIYCDNCNHGYHLKCLSPPLHRVPKDDWFCPKKRCQLAGKKSLRARRDIAMIQAYTITDPEIAKRVCAAFVTSSASSSSSITPKNDASILSNVDIDTIGASMALEGVKEAEGVLQGLLKEEEKEKEKQEHTMIDMVIDSGAASAPAASPSTNPSSNETSLQQSGEGEGGDKGKEEEEKKKDEHEGGELKTKLATETESPPISAIPYKIAGARSALLTAEKYLCDVATVIERRRLNAEHEIESKTRYKHTVKRSVKAKAKADTKRTTKKDKEKEKEKEKGKYTSTSTRALDLDELASELNVGVPQAKLENVEVAIGREQIISETGHRLIVPQGGFLPLPDAPLATFINEGEGEKMAVSVSVIVHDDGRNNNASDQLGGGGEGEGEGEGKEVSVNVSSEPVLDSSSSKKMGKREEYEEEEVDGGEEGEEEEAVVWKKEVVLMGLENSVKCNVKLFQLSDTDGMTISEDAYPDSITFHYPSESKVKDKEKEAPNNGLWRKFVMRPNSVEDDTDFHTLVTALSQWSDKTLPFPSSPSSTPSTSLSPSPSPDRSTLPMAVIRRNNVETVFLMDGVKTRGGGQGTIYVRTSDVSVAMDESDF